MRSSSPPKEDPSFYRRQATLEEAPSGSRFIESQSVDFFPIGEQIENEYNNVALAYKEEGTKYVQWAAKMAVGLETGVPWVMCKQTDAPDPVASSSLIFHGLEEGG